MKKICFTLMMLLLLLLVGCERSPSVGMCFRYGENNGTAQLENYLTTELQAAGWEVAAFDAFRDQSRQNAQIDRLLEDGCDLLIVEPVMTLAAEEILNLAKEAAVPVIFLNFAPNEAVLDIWEQAFYIGSDMSQPGTLQTQLVQQLPDGGDRNGDGTVAYTVIGGPEDHMDAERWTQDCGRGFLRLWTDRGEWSRDSGRMFCRRQITRYGDSVDVIFCNSDELALGALEALQNEETEVYLIGIGDGSEALQQIREGTMTGTVCPNWKALGVCIAQTAVQVLNGTEVPKTQLLDFVMVTKDTLE